MLRDHNLDHKPFELMVCFVYTVIGASYKRAVLLHPINQFVHKYKAGTSMSFEQQKPNEHRIREKLKAASQTGSNNEDKVLI